MIKRNLFLKNVAIILVATVISFSLFPELALAQSPATINLNPPNLEKGVIMPPEFIGLSFEMEKVLPESNGKYYFSPENKPLIAIFKTLGIKSLRVGGNTADRPTIKVPSKADLDSLFAFAKAADVKIIFTLRMREGDPKVAADLAKYIMDHYKSDLTCFAIGNEPNVFAKEYPAYRDLWKSYMETIVAPGSAPDAKFCGPGATPGKTAWAKDFATDLGDSGRVVLITQHDYPGGSARTVTDAAGARDKMLSPAWVKGYEKFYAKFVPAAKAKNLPFRLEEANSFFNGGAKDVSDTFASALWALDYAYWWAMQEANGINFHTGDKVAAGGQNTSCKYAAFLTAPGGYSACPIAYGLKAFDLTGRGRLMPLDFASNADGINLTAYAVSGQNNILFITLINKEHGSNAREANISIAPGGTWNKADTMSLTAPKGDVSTTSGVTLGGAEIKTDGSWQGTWTPLANPPDSGNFTIKVPAATAVVIRLTTK
jgi:Glycosyl hydrolase family 79 C-terminal beta domain